MLTFFVKIERFFHVFFTVLDSIFEILLSQLLFAVFSVGSRVYGAVEDTDSLGRLGSIRTSRRIRLFRACITA